MKLQQCHFSLKIISVLVLVLVHGKSVIFVLVFVLVHENVTELHPWSRSARAHISGIVQCTMPEKQTLAENSVLVRVGKF